MGMNVITGGPCSGKTSVIEELEARGYSVVYESAREVIKEFGKPKSLTEARRNQFEIVTRQKEKENLLERGVILKGQGFLGKDIENPFLDRSNLDNVAYGNLFGSYIPPVLQEINFIDKYGVVFILDRLPYQKDEERDESPEKAEAIHKKIYSTYIEQGYEPVIVPVVSIKKRVDFILDHLKLRK